MSILPNLLRSLILTGIFSFLTPMLFIGLILALLVFLGHIPKLDVIGNSGFEHVLGFLVIFGSGSAIQGVLTISTVGGLVGMLFDAYTFYRYQNLRD
jgi:hypothetical protein